MRVRLQRLCGALILSFLASAAAHAQAWPQKPIRMIVPFAPGGGTDVIGRFVAKHLSQRLGQQVYVENRAGANGAIGLQALAQAEPDGYTIAACSDTPLVVNPWLHDTLPYQTLRDFVLVTTTAKFPGLVAVHPSVPARNIGELIALAKKKPGELTYGTAGIGNFSHLAGELLSLAADIKMQPVHFKGVAPATMGLLSGDVQVMFNNIQTSIEHVRAGRMIALAVNEAQRVPALPDLPTIAETIPGFEISGWQAVCAPAKTPRDIVSRLSREIRDIMHDPDVVRGLADQHVIPFIVDGDAAVDLIKRDLGKWERVIKSARIKDQ